MNKILTPAFDELTFCRELVHDVINLKKADDINKTIEDYAAVLKDWKEYHAHNHTV